MYCMRVSDKLTNILFILNMKSHTVNIGVNMFTCDNLINTTVYG